MFQRWLMLLGIIFVTPPVYGQNRLPRDFILIAHRGVVTGTIKENSLQALEESIRRGYTHMEVDLRCTKDGHAVCLHDASLKRTFGVDKQIHEITLAELHEAVDPQLAPSFATLCVKCEGRINLMPDVKHCPTALRDEFAVSIENSLNRHGLMENAVFIGQDYIVDRFHGKGRLSWRHRIGKAKPQGREGNPGKFYFVFERARDLNQKKVDGFHAMGLQVIVGINTFHYPRQEQVGKGLADVKKMLDLGVDGVQIDSVYEPAVWEYFSEGRQTANEVE